MPDEIELKILLIPALLFSIWFCVGLVGIIKELIKGRKYTKSDIKDLGFGLLLLFLWCFAIWVFLYFGTFLLDYLFAR
jgi:hypothetical protein